MSELEALRSEVTALRHDISTVVNLLRDRYIDRHEFAQRLGVHPSTLDRRVKAGSVPAPVNGKWLLSEVEAFVKLRRVA